MAPGRETRWYISGLDGRDAQRLHEAVRGHWGIENRRHWSLDASFKEDHRRQRVNHAGENLSRLCRIALNLLKWGTSKPGIANKRLACGWNRACLLEVLMNLGQRGCMRLPWASHRSVRLPVR